MEVRPKGRISEERKMTKYYDTFNERFKKKDFVST